MSIFGRKKDISNMVFDWNLYWKDIGSGVDNKVIVKKMLKTCITMVVLEFILL